MPFSLKVTGTEDLGLLMDLASAVGSLESVHGIYGQGYGVFHVGEFPTRVVAEMAKERLEELAPDLQARIVVIPRGRMGEFITKAEVSGLSTEWLKRVPADEAAKYYSHALQERESTAPGTLFSSMYYGALVNQARETDTEDALLDVLRRTSPKVRESFRSMHPEYGERLYDMLGKDLEV